VTRDKVFKAIVSYAPDCPCGNYAVRSVLDAIFPSERLRRFLARIVGKETPTEPALPVAVGQRWRLIVAKQARWRGRVCTVRSVSTTGLVAFGYHGSAPRTTNYATLDRFLRCYERLD
jgi:hypothetical protein